MVSRVGPHGLEGRSPDQTDGRTDKISPVFYRTLSLWGRCPAYNWKIWNKEEKQGKGTADHILTLFFILLSTTTSTNTNTITTTTTTRIQIQSQTLKSSTHSNRLQPISIDFNRSQPISTTTTSTNTNTITTTTWIQIQSQTLKSSTTFNSLKSTSTDLNRLQPVSTDFFQLAAFRVFPPLMTSLQQNKGIVQAMFRGLGMCDWSYTHHLLLVISALLSSSSIGEEMASKNSKRRPPSDQHCWRQAAKSQAIVFRHQASTNFYIIIVIHLLQLCAFMSFRFREGETTFFGHDNIGILLSMSLAIASLPLPMLLTSYSMLLSSPLYRHCPHLYCHCYHPYCHCHHPYLPVMLLVFLKTARYIVSS